MSKEHRNVCPGCSRHCTAGHERCKFGQKYFEKNREKQKAKPDDAGKAEEKKHRCRWEKYVNEGELAWKFLMTARKSKRKLRGKQISEQAWLAALNETERAQLGALLEKISATLE